MDQFANLLIVGICLVLAIVLAIVQRPQKQPVVFVKSASLDEWELYLFLDLTIGRSKVGKVWSCNLEFTTSLLGR